MAIWDHSNPEALEQRTGQEYVRVQTPADLPLTDTIVTVQR